MYLAGLHRQNLLTTQSQHSSTACMKHFCIPHKWRVGERISGVRNQNEELI